MQDWESSTPICTLIALNFRSTFACGIAAFRRQPLSRSGLAFAQIDKAEIDSLLSITVLSEELSWSRPGWPASLP